MGLDIKPIKHEGQADSMYHSCYIISVAAIGHLMVESTLTVVRITQVSPQQVPVKSSLSVDLSTFKLNQKIFVALSTKNRRLISIPMQSYSTALEPTYLFENEEASHSFGHRTYCRMMGACWKGPDWCNKSYRYSITQPPRNLVACR